MISVLHTQAETSALQRGAAEAADGFVHPSQRRVVLNEAVASTLGDSDSLTVWAEARPLPATKPRARLLMGSD